MRCIDCAFIKQDGDTFCLLNMHKITDIYHDEDCEILNNYREHQEDSEEINNEQQ